MPTNTQTRKITSLDTDWRFVKADPANAESPAIDDAAWENVRIPHDWAITGPFDKNHDLQVTTVVEDGEEKPHERSGRTGSLPHVGKGWYRKSFSVQDCAPDCRFFIEFDGVMCNSKIYLNGQLIGSWPYGYSSFCFELTDNINHDGDNILAVSVDVKPNASRWYPGAGIYRNVRLVATNPIHVAHWGTYITTPDISDTEATVRIRTSVLNQGDQTADIELQTDILDASGKKVASTSSVGIFTRLRARAMPWQADSDTGEGKSVHIATADQTFVVKNPMLWDIESPHLYKAISKVIADGEIVDEYETSFGIREFRFDKDEGFFLNGQRVQLNGVCMHHDLGPLGAAVNTRALERQWDILVEMGCNALRTSHNPPTPELLELCDRRGIVVIDEAFDEWRRTKCENGYNKLFDEWAEKDMRALIKRDRNHPCVIMWSIGNEIPEQAHADGAERAQYLVDICHDEDPTRPTTAGLNNSDRAIKNELADALDVPGWNYRPTRYNEYHEANPDWPMYASETESCVSSRGVYHFPAEAQRGQAITNESLHISSYDMCEPGWGNAPDIEFAAQDDCPFIAGEFVWTGFDYLGEPTPYNSQWPSRSSYFGIVDLCGLPKDRYYLYRSKWRPDVETLHILPHWNWAGREGEITPVHCYTNRNAAELFINGKSQGIRRKDKTSVYDRYRLRWNDVKYEPGTLRVVAFDENDKPIAEKEMKTADTPAAIELRPHRTTINSDGIDLSFITVRIADSDGIFCPLADNLVTFNVAGPGRVVAVGNGDQTSVEPFVANYRKTFHGLCVVIVGSVAGATGEITVNANADGLAPAETVLTSQP